MKRKAIFNQPPAKTSIYESLNKMFSTNVLYFTSLHCTSHFPLLASYYVLVYMQDFFDFFRIIGSAQTSELIVGEYFLNSDLKSSHLTLISLSLQNLDLTSF